MNRSIVASAVVLALTATAFGALRDGPRSDARELRQRLDRLDEPTRFAFEHRPLGTRVVECFLANRALNGQVDVGKGTLVLTEPSGREVFRRVGPRAFVRGSLLAGVNVDWVEVDGVPPSADRAALVDALGPDLGNYVVAGGLPPSGVVTARAALGDADEIVALDRDRYRLQLPPSGTDEPSVVIDVTLTASAVRQVTVRTTGRDEDATGGWTITYSALTAAPEVSAPASVVRLDDLDASTLVGVGRAATDCELQM